MLREVRRGATPEAVIPDSVDVVHVARTQLRMLEVGALNWRSRPPAGDLASAQPTSKTTLPNS